MQSLDDLHSAIKQTAIDKGLTVVDDLPGLSRFPTIVWKSGWKEYLDCAIQVHASLLYLKKWLYNPQILVTEVVDEQELSFSRDEDEDNEKDDEGVTVVGSPEWLQERLEEAIAPWAKHSSEVFGISSIWVKEGVAHFWSYDAEWYSEHRNALETALQQAGQVEEGQRTLLSKEETLKYHEYATQLAHHPRFSEAKSIEKRMYMASQLFPEIESVFPQNYRPTFHVAKRAELIYWWEVEATEKATKTDRAKLMYKEGETIQNIAAVLNISQAKVRAALREP